MKHACAAACLWIVLAAGQKPADKGKQGPVDKVVGLLKDLKTKIEEDGKEEQRVYDKYACWCEKTTARKATAITDARDELVKLGQTILKNKGTVAIRMSEIAELTKGIKENEEAQAELTSAREKENEAFQAETGEMKDVLVALAKALVVLRDGTSGSFLQRGTAGDAALMAVVDALPSGAALKPKHAALLKVLVHSRSSGKYAPQSATIQGILDDMYSTFSQDLESATETEGQKNRDFETLMNTKAEQLKVMQKDLATKTKEKMEAETQLADSSQDYDDTEAQMTADVAFFDDAKQACETKTTQWDERSKLRTEELEGITKAIEILSSDDAKKLFASAIKPGMETHVDESKDAGVKTMLLQISSGKPEARAYAALKASATRTRSLRMAMLAAQLRQAKVGHFDKVIKAIDDMIMTLKGEGADDLKKRDNCVEEYQKSASTIAKVEWLIEKNKAKIAKLEGLIADLEKEIKKTDKDITDIKADIKDMEDERKKENTAFKAAKKEDQDAIKLLVEARDFLVKYYKKNDVKMGPVQGSVKGFLQAGQAPEFKKSEDQAPEADFSSKGSRKNESKGIIQLMTMIIEDLTDEIKNGMKDEEIAQLDFEKQHAAAKKLQSELEEKLVNLKSMLAKRKVDKGDEEKDMKSNEGDLKKEKDYVKSIKPDCDWIIDKFDKRAELRAAEMDGLVGAKEFLAGYAPEADASL